MIEHQQIKWICQNHIREILRPHPAIIHEVLEGPDFVRFVDLCTHRCRELARINCMPTQFSFLDFVKKAVTQFAINKINERLGTYKRQCAKPYEIITHRDAEVLSEVPPQD